MQRFSLSAIRFDPGLQTPCVFALAMLVGAAWYFSVDAEPPFGVILLIMISSSVSWRMLQGRHIPAATGLALLICSGASSGALSGSVATARGVHTPIQQPIGPVLVEGWIVRVEPAAKGARLVLRLHAIDGVSSAETPDQVRLTHILDLRMQPGRFVRCWAVLRPPPAPVIQGDYAFDRQAWYSGLGGVGYVQGRCRGGTVGPPRDLRAKAGLQLAEWRRQLARHVNQASGHRAGGFAAALASGDRSYMLPADQAALRGSGLAHLLAISGLHMGIVGGLVFLILWRGLSLIEPFALRFPVRKAAAVGALMACSAYLLISGGSISTQRAFIMAVTVFGAVMVDRTALSLRSLALAMIAILILAPWSVLSPGFQMSFAAAGALIATYEAWRNRQNVSARMARFSFWLKSLLVTSLVSSLATMPFAIFHFGRVSGLGVLANLAAMPVISLISAPLAAAVLVLAPFGGDSIALRLFGASLEIVLAIAHTVSGMSAGTRLQSLQMPGPSLVLFTVSITAYCLVSGLWTRCGTVLITAAAALVIWFGTAKDQLHWSPSGDLFLEYANGQVDRYHLIKADGLAPLSLKDIPRSELCAPERICTIAFRETEIRWRSDPDDRNIRTGEQGLIILEPSSLVQDAKGHLTILWSDVVRENGVTLTRRSAGFSKAEKPLCGLRVWRPCPPDLPPEPIHISE